MPGQYGGPPVGAPKRTGLSAGRGATLPKLLDISRHRQIETLRRYLQAVDLFMTTGMMTELRYPAII
jgi:hypothetical protein